MSGLDDREAAELYALPLEEFIAERNALAERRRKAGDGEAARAIKALPKPTVAAWATNQLARRHSEDMKELLEAGDELRATHEALLSGDRDADVSGAAQRERAAVGRLVKRARRLDLSDAALERVAETLHAAAGSDELRDRLRRGVVVREEQAAMFGGLGAGAAASAPPRSRRRSGKTKEDEAERRERDRVEREERERAERLQAARAQLRRLRSEHGKARRAAEAAERRLARARKEMESRQQETDAALSRRDDAERALAETEELIERLGG